MKVFDSHFHIIDTRFPLIANSGYLPQPFTTEDYLKKVNDLHVLGGAVVSGSFQAFDQNYLIAALKTLGSHFVGVTQIPTNVSDQSIIDLHQAGVRAVRFNIKRGGSASIEDIQSLALRCYALVKWHSEFYLDAINLPDIYDILLKLPAVSIDHLGLSKEGFPHLLKMVEHGAHVKATGFGRVNFDVIEMMKKITAVNPDCLMFGTDLPSTRAPRPFTTTDLSLIINHFNALQAEKILFSNAVDFYGVTNLKM
ncbi:amidohydrolase family protein [Legionella maioricensis]|uniref:Amidohydrolase family protein n=1 Tax=Legionella maioricensis TaxID=2896528 RepID=A0A9X2D1G6_9GAMM|nr:amidohydrolase family protein [Legionella maioricensis]MCL9684880.1 amidohydrolase family protein [Legionella maioricensis]MCL9688956.1 amidohydrolase family protein [Legionella maioricensis]